MGEILRTIRYLNPNSQQVKGNHMGKKLGPPSSLPKLAILGGTGKEGPGLAMRWALAGYTIIIGSRKTEKAQATAAKLNEQLNIETIKGKQNNEAAQSADICVLTVVYSAHQAALESLKEDLQGKILVDATARIDFRDPRPPSPPSAARIAQDILGEGVRVVAAFQNVPAHVLSKNLGGTLDTDVLVCADEPAAADEIIKLAGKGLGIRYFVESPSLSCLGSHDLGF
jgi:NADPH-dependent F420 reductase